MSVFRLEEGLGKDTSLVRFEQDMPYSRANSIDNHVFCWSLLVVLTQGIYLLSY